MNKPFYNPGDLIKIKGTRDIGLLIQKTVSPLWVADVGCYKSDDHKSDWYWDVLVQGKIKKFAIWQFYRFTEEEETNEELF